MKKDSPLQQIQERTNRLRNSTNILGQPDIMTQIKSKVISTFLGKQKKQQTKISYYVAGLHFPTTAHFSSFITSNLTSLQTKNTVLKVRLYMFDAFKQRDIHVQVSIPGSLEIKMYNLQGQPYKATQQDYQRAYYSSVLRSLYPSQYNKIRLYNNVYKCNTLKSFVISFVPFSFSNNLRTLGYDLGENTNHGLQLVIKFIIQTKSYNLGKILYKQLNKIDQQKAIQFQLKVMLSKGQLDKVLSKTSELLMENQQSKNLKSLQLKALIKMKKYQQAKILAQFIIHQGVFYPQVWTAIADYHLNNGKDSSFLKIINTGLFMLNQQQKKLEDLINAKPSFKINQILSKSNRLSQFSQLCFKLDHSYLNRLIKIDQFKQALQKANKQRHTLFLIKKIDESLNQDISFYENIVHFEKQKGWNKLIKLRTQTFWLEKDFKNYQNQIKGKKSLSQQSNATNISISNVVPEKILMNQSINNFEENQFVMSPQKQESLQERQRRIMQDKSGSNRNQSPNRSFQGNFSEIQQEDQSIAEVQPCSKRIISKRISHDIEQPQTKLLCSLLLQKIFLRLFQDIKLQSLLQKWAQKLGLINSKENTKSKNQLIAIVFMKKGFLHKKLKRKRKCEESFKSAMKYSQSFSVNLISCYSLATLYLQNRNIKGVQYYIMQVVRILMQVGITSFDVIPEWAKQILAFVVQIHGKKIVNRVTGPLRQLLTMWLCMDNQLVERPKNINKTQQKID